MSHVLSCSALCLPHLLCVALTGCGSEESLKEDTVGTMTQSRPVAHEAPEMLIEERCCVLFACFPCFLWILAAHNTPVLRLGKERSRSVFRGRFQNYRGFKPQGLRISFTVANIGVFFQCLTTDTNLPFSQNHCLSGFLEYKKQRAYKTHTHRRPLPRGSWPAGLRGSLGNVHIRCSAYAQQQEILRSSILHTCTPAIQTPGACMQINSSQQLSAPSPRGCELLALSSKDPCRGRFFSE